MAEDCSLIKPQTITFHIPENYDKDINNKFSKSNLSGSIDLLYAVTMPNEKNRCLVILNLENVRNSTIETAYIDISESNCRCTNTCITDLGIQRSNERHFLINFKNLIEGDEYIATGCVHYIE